MNIEKILIIFSLALIVVRIPIIGKYIRVLNTMVHESGHAIMALFTSGRVQSISLFMNTEGVATTGTRNWFGRVLTSLAGYPFSSVAAFVFIYLYTNEKEIWIIYTLLAFIVVNLLLWVRNFYGIVWLLTFGALLGSALVYTNDNYLSYLSLFLTFLLLIEAMYTCIVIFKLSIKTPKEAGDATNLKNATFIPVIVWGVVFLLQGIYFFSYSLLLLYQYALELT